MIELSVGTKFESQLVEELIRQNERSERVKVKEIYGSIGLKKGNGIMSTARQSYRLTNDLRDIENVAKLCDDNDIKIAYTMNSIVVPSLHTVADSLKELKDYLKTLENIGIYSVTVANPLVMEVIAAHTNLKINVSTICHVDNIHQMRTYKEMGVRKIVLSYMHNRNIKLLEQAVKEDMPIELMTNETCLKNCPYRMSCYSIESLTENEEPYQPEGEIVDIKGYPYSRCFKETQKNWPHGFLKTAWIRPEDLKKYEELGIRHFKITGRTQRPEKILSDVAAYIDEKYDGNLLDIMPLIAGSDRKEGGEFTDLAIDNRKLDGFLDYFFKKKPYCDVDCGTNCKYCENYLRG
ncbi:U32 family peptidase [Cellulosilyticum ruminicola]|uniref:U32 family peptidase n=1 Tax=Cellulosilyticum ruminicola TaxID=425254 RepID=UPI0006D2621F|nr:U32 family peptidase [Cellulosilyticum ruminicola]